MKSFLKLSCLMLKRVLRALFSRILFILPCIFVLFSVFVSFWLLLPGLFDRAPNFLYFTHKLELPLTYEMSGSVRVLDCEGNVINDSVTISVGGYSDRMGTNTDYELFFSSSKQDYCFVTITYKDSKGVEHVYTEKVSFPDGSNVFREDYIIDC